MMPTLPERVTNAIREIELCRCRGGQLDVQRANALEQQLHDTIAVLAEHGWLERRYAEPLDVTYPGQPE